MSSLPLKQLAKASKLLLNLALCTILASCSMTSTESSNAKTDHHWTEAYANSPAAYSLPADVPPVMLTFVKPKEVAGTLRSSFVISASGSMIRIRLSNEAGTKPLVIKGVSVALAKPASMEPSDTPTAVTFGDKTEFTIPPGSPLLSDPIPLVTQALSRLVVSVFTPSGFSAVPLGGEGMMLAPGDQTQQAVMTEAQTLVARSPVSGISVASSKALPVVVTLGDSITDGARVKPEQLAGYPATLMNRLAMLPSDDQRALVNVGTNR